MELLKIAVLLLQCHGAGPGPAAHGQCGEGGLQALRMGFRRLIAAAGAAAAAHQRAEAGAPRR